MKTTNAKLLYYDKYVDCTYPTGEYFMLNVDYIHSVVQNILKVYDKKIGTLYLVGTNRSGNILLGGIATKLIEMGRDVVVYGFPRSHHEGRSLCIPTNSPVIMVDDFISSRNTVIELTNQVLNTMEASKNKLDMLCVSNELDEKGGDLCNIYDTYKIISKLFNYICCNNKQLRERIQTVW